MAAYYTTRMNIRFRYGFHISRQIYNAAIANPMSAAKTYYIHIVVIRNVLELALNLTFSASLETITAVATGTIRSPVSFPHCYHENVIVVMTKIRTKPVPAVCNTHVNYYNRTYNLNQ